MPEEDGFDVFAVPDFWQTSRLLKPLSATEFFTLDGFTLEQSHEETQIHVYQPTLAIDGFFKLPQTLEANPVAGLLTETDAPTGAGCDADFLGGDDDSGIDLDLWLDAAPPVAAPAPSPKTWESFQTPPGAATAAALPRFLSESGPAAFDAAMTSASDALGMGNGDYRVVAPAAFHNSLLNLALGRDSVLFRWSDDKKTFLPTLAKARVSGYSGHVLSGLVSSCSRCGGSAKFVASLSRRTYSLAPSPCRVALAHALDAVVAAVQAGLERRGRDAGSLLQLQAAVAPAEQVVGKFAKLGARLHGAEDDEALLSALFAHVAATADADPGGVAADLSREVLRRVSAPFFEFVQRWIGTLPDDDGGADDVAKVGRSFVGVRRRAWVDSGGEERTEPEYFLEEGRVPDFVPAEVARAMFEAGRNLRFLRSAHPAHPLAASGRRCVVAESRPPHLQWRFDWDALLGLERRALRYEAALRAAVRRSRRLRRFGAGAGEVEVDDAARSRAALEPPTGYELRLFGQSDAAIERGILASMAALDGPLMTPAESSDSMAAIVRAHLDTSSPPSPSSSFTPHPSLLPSLCLSPLITSHSRVVAAECARLLFTSHALLAHLAALRDFHLFGNGLFCARLSHALFDADLDPARREAGGVALAGGGGELGLRLGAARGADEDSWPPASSELRLALIGVLADSYVARGGSSSAKPRPKPPSSSSSHNNPELLLPGDLSFSVRDDLTEAQMARCADPDALEALDFLRLSYAAPPALAAVVTPRALARYDACFALLLRVLRLRFVADRLFAREVCGRRRRKWRGKAKDRREDADNTHDNTALRFAFEARHFVGAVASYFLDTAVAAPWRRFYGELEELGDKLARDLGGEDGDGGDGDDGLPADFGERYGPDRLRERHDAALDEIMAGLLLRKRQRPVLGVLEDVFALVLQFAKAGAGADADEQGARGGDHEAEPRIKVARLYKDFRKKVDVFTIVCRGLDDRGSYGATTGRRPGEEGTIAQLLVKLDMSN